MQPPHFADEEIVVERPCDRLMVTSCGGHAEL